MNKWTTITIATLLLAAGCSDGKEQGVTKKDLPAVAEGPSTEAGTFPLVKDKITLKVLAVKNPSVQDYSTNEFTKWYEEKTNVKIEWQFATPQDRQEKLNLVLATNDLPDMIIGFGVSPAQQMVYGQQGLFIALNNLIDKYGVETKKLWKNTRKSSKRRLLPMAIYIHSAVSTVTHIRCFNKKCGLIPSG